MNRTVARSLVACFLVGLLALLGGTAGCGRTGPVAVGPKPEPGVKIVPAIPPLKPGEVVEVPFILWGGDVATFHANGGLETRPGTLFHKHGLKLKLTRGDDFDKQVDAYLKNQSPFLRGTMSMLGQAS